MKKKDTIFVLKKTNFLINKIINNNFNINIMLHNKCNFKIKNKILKIKSIKIIILNGNIKFIEKNNFFKRNISRNENYITLNKKKKKKIITLKIKKKQNIKIPIYIIYINYIIQNYKFYLYIDIDKNSNINLIEHHINIYNKKNIIFFKKKINLNINSNLNITKLIDLNFKSYFFYKENINNNKKSKLYQNIFILNYKIITLKSKIILKKKSKINLNSISILKNNKFFYKTKIYHIHKKTKSFQKHKSLTLENGNFEFNGEVKINNKTYETESYISNINLCLSSNSKIKSTPKFKIYSQNTNCNHNSIITNINKKQLFYILSRGIDNNEAKKIISISFIYEIINNIKINNFKKHINNLIIKYILE